MTAVEETLLGLPLDMALARLRQAGITPRVQRTQAPVRGGVGRTEGTERVLRVKEGVLVTALFPDQTPTGENQR